MDNKDRFYLHLFIDSNVSEMQTDFKTNMANGSLHNISFQTRLQQICVCFESEVHPSIRCLECPSCHHYLCVFCETVAMLPYTDYTVTPERR